MLDAFDAMFARARRSNIEEIIYKCVPSVYTCIPAEEDKYCLFRHEAILFRRDVISIVFSAGPAPLQSRRRRAAEKASKNGVTINYDSEDWKISGECYLTIFTIATVFHLFTRSMRL